MSKPGGSPLHRRVCGLFTVVLAIAACSSGKGEFGVSDAAALTASRRVMEVDGEVDTDLGRAPFSGIVDFERSAAELRIVEPDGGAVTHRWVAERHAFRSVMRDVGDTGWCEVADDELLNPAQLIATLQEGEDLGADERTERSGVVHLSAFPETQELPTIRDVWFDDDSGMILRIVFSPADGETVDLSLRPASEPAPSIDWRPGTDCPGTELGS